MNKKIMHLSRILLGVIFLGAGLNGFIVFFGFESLFPTSPEAMALFTFDYLLVAEKSLEVICGMLLLVNRYVPLAIAVLLPLVVNILLLHLFLDPSLLFLAIILLILEGYLLIFYKAHFIQIFDKKPQ
ncbi:hypothetical protein SAMN05880501_106182 [Ureibacillus xyleni]|uniref:DoxX-like protein n=1 Tax=Ureibacillus xyleni TaxID=614648 RepID=A0A285SSQ7_9BACL|nr:hypothetical protein [Ureibacillus xyleni]SOC11509.1 hypothetical protein SAMN05880501_106182 [Ureibacillus xyleni]